MGQPAEEPSAIAVDPRLILLLGRAAVLGPTAALAATGFVVVAHEAEGLLWDVLPERLGMDEPAWWWVVSMLAMGALLTAAALRLPGHGGHSPLDGLAFDIGPRMALSVVAAAFASLSFGAVLGPEAPALALGTALGFMVAGWRVDPDSPDLPQNRALLMLAGGIAAFGAVLGNPLALAVFLLEAGFVARRSSLGVLSLAPVAVALAFGYLVQVGLGAWAGLGEVVLSVPNLAPYPNVLAVDVVVTLVLAVVTATVIHLSFVGGGRVRRLALSRGPLPVLLGAALTTAAVALVARQVTGEPVDSVLFSGQQAVPQMLAATSAGAVIVVMVAKAAAYALCLGSGFRGGAVFPAVYIGAGMGVLGGLLVGPASTTGLVAAGIAAGTVATIRLPFSATLLAVLLVAEAGLAVTTPALLGAVVGLLTVLVLERTLAPRMVAPEDETEHATSG